MWEPRLLLLSPSPSGRQMHINPPPSSSCFVYGANLLVSHQEIRENTQHYNIKATLRKASGQGGYVPKCPIEIEFLRGGDERENQIAVVFRVRTTFSRLPFKAKYGGNRKWKKGLRLSHMKAKEQQPATLPPWDGGGGGLPIQICIIGYSGKPCFGRGGRTGGGGGSVSYNAPEIQSELYVMLFCST